MKMQNLLQFLKMLENDEKNIHLSYLNQNYNEKHLPDKIAPYIIKKSLANFDVKLHYSLLTKTSKQALQNIYPGLFSHYFKNISADEHLCKCMLYVIERVNMKKEEQTFVFNFILKNVYDKNLYEFVYKKYSNAEFGLVLLEKNVDINLYVIEEKICNILDLVTYITVKKPDNTTSTLNNNNGTTHYKILKQYMKDKKTDEKMNKQSKILVWPENTLFAKEIEFRKFIRKHAVKFVHNKQIQKYISYSGKRYGTPVKQLKLCDMNDRIDKIVKKYSTDDAYNLLISVDNIQEKQIQNLILLCMSDTKFAKKILRYEKQEKVNKFVVNNYNNLINNVILLLENVTEKGLIIFTNLINIHYDNCAIKAFATIFDLIFEQNNIKSYLFCLYKIAKHKKIDRACIWYIFNELIYLDKDDYRIRCCVYEILNILIKDYYEMDKLINEANQKMLEQNNQQNFDEKYKIVKNGFELDKNPRISQIDYMQIDKKNIKVIANKIWDDFTEESNMFEYLCILKLLITIIKCTDSFYEQRMQKSKVFEKMVQKYESYEKTKQLDNLFYMFVCASLKNFSLTKHNLEILYNLCVNYECRETKKIVKKLVKIDFYFIFYLSQNKKTKHVWKSIKREYKKNSEVSVN